MGKVTLGAPMVCQPGSTRTSYRSRVVLSLDMRASMPGAVVRCYAVRRAFGMFFYALK
jgi:hypothetical protein